MDKPRADIWGKPISTYPLLLSASTRSTNEYVSSCPCQKAFRLTQFKIRQNIKIHWRNVSPQRSFLLATSLFNVNNLTRRHVVVLIAVFQSSYPSKGEIGESFEITSLGLLFSTKAKETARIYLIRSGRWGLSGDIFRIRFLRLSVVRLFKRRWKIIVLFIAKHVLMCIVSDWYDAGVEWMYFLLVR